jgi:archaellum biogenesis ATPase FlaH
VKFRVLPPKDKELGLRYLRLPNCETILFNADAVEKNSKVFLCEGEFNAISAWDHGIENVVAVTAGAKSFLPQYHEALRGHEVVIVFDQDATGQEGAREVARRIGMKQCLNLVLPKPDGEKKRDLNEFFLSGGSKEKFESLAEKTSVRFDVENVSRIDALLQRALQEDVDETRGLIEFPWPSLQMKLKRGIRGGELIVIGAHPSTGKTTFSLQVCEYNALRQTPSLLYCLETPAVDLALRLPQFMFGKKLKSLDSEEKTTLIQTYANVPLYLAYSSDITKKEIFDTIRASVEMYGLKLVVFDNLQFSVRSLENETGEISLAIREFKSLAMEYGIVVGVISQPVKNADKALPPTPQDMKGSQAIASDADRLITLWRREEVRENRDRYEDPRNARSSDRTLEKETSVRLAKDRYGPGGEIWLQFSDVYGKFIDEIGSLSESIKRESSRASDDVDDEPGASSEEQEMF